MVRTDNLDKLLAGDEGYEVWNPNASLPTDPEQVFNACLEQRNGIDTPSDAFWTALESLSKRSDRGWLAMYYVMQTVYWQRRTDCQILSQDFLFKLGSNLLVNKGILRKDMRWGGQMFEQGLWQLVCNLNVILRERHNISVFREEDLEGL
jgi:hypothetical protein